MYNGGSPTTLPRGPHPGPRHAVPLGGPAKLWEGDMLGYEGGGGVWTRNTWAIDSTNQPLRRPRNNTCVVYIKSKVL